MKQVKHVQRELLGDHQDAVVARPVLREIGMAARLDGENGFTYGLLHQQQTDAERLHEGDITRATTCGAACAISPAENVSLSSVGERVKSAGIRIGVAHRWSAASHRSGTRRRPAHERDG